MNKPYIPEPSDPILLDRRERAMLRYALAPMARIPRRADMVVRGCSVGEARDLFSKLSEDEGEATASESTVPPGAGS